MPVVIADTVPVVIHDTFLYFYTQDRCFVCFLFSGYLLLFSTQFGFGCCYSSHSWLLLSMTHFGPGVVILDTVPAFSACCYSRHSYSFLFCKNHLLYRFFFFCCYSQHIYFFQRVVIVDTVRQLLFRAHWNSRPIRVVIYSTDAL